MVEKQFVSPAGTMAAANGAIVTVNTNTGRLQWRWIIEKRRVKMGLERRVHYSIKLDTSGVVLHDGSKAVCLDFFDKESFITDTFPISIDIAYDLSKELKRIVRELEALP